MEVAKNEATRAYFIEDCDHTFNVFSGDYTAINEAIQAGIDFVKEVFGQEQAPADEAVAEERGSDIVNKNGTPDRASRFSSFFAFLLYFVGKDDKIRASFPTGKYRKECE